MKVLVTGATGKVGSLLVTELIERGADVRIFTRNEPNPKAVPKEVEVAVGDLLDPESVARAMGGIDKLFLLNAVSPSELTEALIGFGMARRARVKHVTYLSAFKADRVKDSPNLAAKFAVECAIGNSDMPFTFLRPNYFIQNDRQLMPMIAGTGLYPVPTRRDWCERGGHSGCGGSRCDFTDRKGPCESDLRFGGTDRYQRSL